LGKTVASQNGVLIEKIVLRKVFQPKRKEVTGEGEILIMKSFVNFTLNQILFFYLAQQPPVGQNLLIHEVSGSRTTTHHSRGIPLEE